MEWISFEEHWYQRSEEGITLATAKALNESGIACVLWGGSCMRRWGQSRSFVLNVEFVVADDKVDQAINCLLEKQPYLRQGVCVCDTPQWCVDWDEDCPQFTSAKHLHWTQGEWARYFEARLNIFGRSELLRMIPMDLLPSDYPDTASFAEAIKPDFCLISDSDILPPRCDRFGLGVGKPGRYPVVMPMPHLMVEIALRMSSKYINFGWTNGWGTYRAVLVHDLRVVDVKRIRHPFLRKIVRDSLKGIGTNPHVITAYFKDAPHIQVWFPPRERKTK